MSDGESSGTSEDVSGQRRPARVAPEANDDRHNGAADHRPERNVRPRTDEGPPREGRYPPNMETPEQVEGARLQEENAHAPNDENARTFLLDIHSFCRVGRPCHILRSLQGEDEKYNFIGKKLFYLPEIATLEERVNCSTFLKAYLDHLVNNRIMLVEGRAGSGKTTLVEQIAMMYISEATNSNSGYLIVTNGCNTLTEQRLFRYMHNGQEYLGPVSTIIRDARAHPESRYVFILHEWNRVSDFMSLLGNFFEEELRAYGPDSWQEMEDNRDDWGAHILQGNVGQATTPDDLYFIPSNFRIILTGNPCRDDFMGETADFMVDPALNANRLVGARVSLDETVFSLDQPGRFPFDFIVANLRVFLSVRYTEASINDLINNIQNSRHEIMPGKLVSEVRKRETELLLPIQEYVSGPRSPENPMEDVLNVCRGILRENIPPWNKRVKVMLFFLACRENVNTEQETIHELGTLCRRGLTIPNAELQFPEPAQDGIVHFGETRGTQIAQLLHEQLTNTALYKQSKPFLYGFKSLSEMTASMIMDQIPEVCFRKRDARILLHGDANGMLLAVLLDRLRASGMHKSTRVSVTVSQDHSSFFSLYNVVWMGELQDKVEYISEVHNIRDGCYDIIAAFPDIMTKADRQPYYDGFFGRVPRFLAKGGVASLLTDCRWINKTDVAATRFRQNLSDNNSLDAYVRFLSARDIHIQEERQENNFVLLRSFPELTCHFNSLRNNGVQILTLQNRDEVGRHVQIPHGVQYIPFTISAGEDLIYIPRGERETAERMQQVITRTDSVRASCSKGPQSNHPDVSRFKVKIPNYAERDKESAFGHPSRYRFSKEAEIISPGDSLPGASLGWAFDSEEEARSFTTYMATDLFNRMGNLCKCTSVLSPETFRLIPKIPWDRTWTNDEITRYFRLG